MRKLTWLIIGFAIAVGYFVLWPVPIDPIAWDAPKAPRLEGVYRVNDALSGMQLIATPNAQGPEDVAIDDLGRIYVGVDSGQILRYDADGRHPQVFASTGGRPLGLHFDANGNLIVADSERGLLSISSAGEVSILCTEVDGQRLVFTDDVDIGPDGIMYFTDASSRFTRSQYRLDLMEGRPHGRLFAYDPNSGVARTLVDDLYFANGVAVAQDGAFVLVNETSRYRVKRHWLKGDRAGQTELFIDNLPGFPDGISRGENGIFWLAFAAPRDELFDSISAKPFIRKMVQRLPMWLQPKPKRHPFILGLSDTGQVLHNLQDASGATFSMTTSVQEHDDWLYVGSLVEKAWGRYPVPR